MTTTDRDRLRAEADRLRGEGWSYREIGAALGVSTFVLAATVGGFRLGLLLMIAVSAGTFACVLALPAHSLHDAHHVGVK